MKSRDGKSQRREEKKKEDQKRESLWRKKIQVHEKVGNSRHTVFFQWFVAPEGWKVGSLKRRRGAIWPDERWTVARLCGAKHISKSKCAKHTRVRTTFGNWDVEKVHAVVARSTFPSQKIRSTPWSEQVGTLLEVEMSKKCTPLWREAHFQVNMYKAHHGRTTFGSWDVEKVHAVVARSTFRSQKCKELTGSEHSWKLRCRKSARRCGAKHISKSKVEKPEGCGALWTFRCRFAWQAQGIVHLVKSEQNAKVCSMSKNDGRRGTFAEDLPRCILRGRRSTSDMFIRAVRSGRWFPERGCILERQIFRFVEMILRDRCNTSYDLVSRFRGRHNTLDRWSGKIAKSIGTRPSALHSTFHFWRKSRRIVSFLMLPTSKSEEVS